MQRRTKYETLFGVHPQFILNWLNAKGQSGKPLSDGMNAYLQTRGGTGITLSEQLNKVLTDAGFTGTLQDKKNAFYVQTTGVSHPADAELSFYQNSSNEIGANEAASYIAAIYAAGGSLDYTNETGKTQAQMEAAITTFINSLKTANLWNSIYWLPLFLGKTPETHKLDARQLETTNFTGYAGFKGFPTDWGGAVRHDPWGVEGDGSTAYGATYLTPAVVSESDPTKVVKSMFFYANRKQTLDATTRYEFGTRDDATYCDGSSVVSSADQEAAINFYGATPDQAANTERGGFFVFCETSNGGGGTGVFLNGTQIVDGAVDSTQPLTQQYILARQNGFGVAADFSNSGFAFFGGGKELSPSQVSTFNTIVQTFMTAIGRDLATVNPLFSTYGFTSSNTPAVTNPSSSASTTFPLRDVTTAVRTISQTVLTQGALSESVYGSAGSGTSLAGKTYIPINSGFYVSSAGVVKRAGSDTTAIIETDTSHAGRITEVPLSLTGGTLSETYSTYETGSLAKKISDDFDAKIAGKSFTDTEIFSSLNHGTSTYVRNASGWMAAVDMTPIPVWTSDAVPIAAYDNARTYSAGDLVVSGGTEYTYINYSTPSAGHAPPNATYWKAQAGGQWGGCLISDRHIIFAKHRGIHQGSTIRFVTSANVVVERLLGYVAPIGDASCDLYLGLLTDAGGNQNPVPGTIGFCKVFPKNYRNKMPSIEGLAVPCFFKNQFNQAVVRDLVLDNSTPTPFYPNSSSLGTTSVAPTDSQRLTMANYYAIVGDSGQGLCTILNNQLILLTTLTTGGTGAGGWSGVNYWYDAINTAMANIGGGTNKTLTDIDISSYPTYNQTDNIGHVSGNSNSDYVFAAVTTTGWMACMSTGSNFYDAVTVPADNTTQDTGIPDNNLTYWSCAGDSNPTPSGEITSLNFSGNTQLGGISKIDASKLLNLVTLDWSAQGVAQTPTSVILPTGSTTLTTIDLSGNTGTAFQRLKNLSALTTVYLAGCSLTGLQIESCPSLSYLDISSNSLAVNDLNAIYTMLPGRTGLTAGQIKASSNTGYATSTTSIATAKNWTFI